MSLFRWTGEHDIFLPEIDAEHRAIFLAGEELHCALLAGAGPERLGEMLRHLAECAESHFLHEERLMRDSRFGAFAWHRHQHDTVRARIRGLAGAGPEALEPALGLLASWLRDHASVADRMMASHVRNWSRGKAA